MVKENIHILQALLLLTYITIPILLPAKYYLVNTFVNKWRKLTVALLNGQSRWIGMLGRLIAAPNI